jgi:hypothetical protein
MRELCEKNQTTKKLWTAIGVAMPAILVILSACALAGDSYNPFMYFQF